MNGFTGNPALTLSSSNTLLPCALPTSSHPIIYLKLNASALDALVCSQTSPEVALELSERTATLKINNCEFRASQYKEPGHVEVYFPTGQVTSQARQYKEDTYQSVGQISNRILIKADKLTKSSPDADQVDYTRNVESKIIQLLQTKPHTAKSLATKTQASIKSVQTILARVAQTQDNELYSLKANTSNMPNQMEESSSVDRGRVEQETVQSSPVETSSRDRNQTDSKPTNTNGANGAKRRATPVTETSKKPKTSDSRTQDMFELARRFRDAYGEYLELYSLLSKRKTRPASQVQRLLVMHKQLSQWKNTLWSNARSKSQVN